MYGPLFIGSIFTMFNSFTPCPITFSSCSSVISNPAPTIKSPLFLSFISLPKYLPTICSFGIEIDFKPFSINFFAITIFNFSPFPKTFLLLFASIIS